MSYGLDNHYHFNECGDFTRDDEFETAKNNGELVRCGNHWRDPITDKEYYDNGDYVPGTGYDC